MAFHSSDSRLRLSGKQYATTYAAKEVQVGIAVTRPPCSDDFWTRATRPMHTLAKVIVKRMYLHWSDRRYEVGESRCLQTMVRYPLALDKEVHRCQPGPYPKHPGFVSMHLSIVPAKATYIQDALGLMALSLRIMSHNTLVKPIAGPTRVLEKAESCCTTKRKNAMMDPIRRRGP